MSTPAKKKKTNFTVSQAAKTLGVSPSTVRAWCRAGLIGKLKEVFGQEWYVLSAADVDHMRDPENRPRMGRPLKEHSGAA